MGWFGLPRPSIALDACPCLRQAGPKPRTVRVEYSNAMHHVMDRRNRLHPSERPVQTASLEATPGEITMHRNDAHFLLAVNFRHPILVALLLVVALLCVGCRPKHAPPVFITDGTIVLLRCGITNAAVIVTKQSGSPEVVDYAWFLRSDGKTTFGATNSTMAKGTVSGARSIAFGPFNIDWSSAGTSGGYVYYPHGFLWLWTPWGKHYPIRLPGGPSMAVATERNIAKINASDPRWRFKR